MHHHYSPPFATAVLALFWLENAQQYRSSMAPASEYPNKLLRRKWATILAKGNDNITTDDALM